MPFITCPEEVLYAFLTDVQDVVGVHRLLDELLKGLAGLCRIAGAFGHSPRHGGAQRTAAIDGSDLMDELRQGPYIHLAPALTGRRLLRVDCRHDREAIAVEHVRNEQDRGLVAQYVAGHIDDHDRVFEVLRDLRQLPIGDAVRGVVVDVLVLHRHTHLALGLEHRHLVRREAHVLHALSRVAVVDVLLLGHAAINHVADLAGQIHVKRELRQAVLED